jgi:hypothetical protein
MRYIYFTLLLFLLSCSAKKSPSNIILTDSLASQVDGESTPDEASYEIEEVAASITVHHSKKAYAAKKEVIVDEVESHQNPNKAKATLAKPSKPKIDIGKIVYKTPDTMTVYKKSIIVVRISKDATSEEIEANLGSFKQSTLSVSSSMSVELVDVAPTDNPAFKIAKVNSDKQSIDSSYTEWTFYVTPVKVGKNELNLVVSKFVGEDKKQVVYERTIYIKSNPIAQVETFWWQNWQFFLTALIIPFIVFLWKRFVDKKKDS